MKAKQKLILIDAGHGGLYKGEYTTPGKRATINGVPFFEGVYNRAIAHLVNFKLSQCGIKSHMLSYDNRDQTLAYRVERVNQLNEEFTCFLISIHQNAFDNLQAHGFEIFTSPGETLSDLAAEAAIEIFKNSYPNRVVRSTLDGRNGKLSKEANFRILKSTTCPAMLTEFGFMTNPIEFDYMSSDKGISDQVNFLTQALYHIHNHII